MSVVVLMQRSHRCQLVVTFLLLILTASCGGGPTEPVRRTPPRLNDQILNAAFGSVRGKIASGESGVHYFGISLRRVGVVGHIFRVFNSASGEFVVDRLAPGTWTISFVGPDFVTLVIKSVTVTAWETTELETIRVAVGRRIFGVVTDDAGVPVPNAVVRVTSRFEKLLSFEDQSDPLISALHGTYIARTNADGSYHITGIPFDGSVPLQIVAAHSHRGLLSIPELVSTGGGRLDPVLLETGSIEGRLTGADRRILIRVTSVTNRRTLLLAIPSKDRSFVFPLIPRGDYELTAVAPGDDAPLASPMRITVRTGEAANVDLTIVGD